MHWYYQGVKEQVLRFVSVQPVLGQLGVKENMVDYISFNMYEIPNWKGNKKTGTYMLPVRI